MISKESMSELHESSLRHHQNFTEKKELNHHIDIVNLKKRQHLKDEGNFRNWEFHKCHEELISFTETRQKRFPLSRKPITNTVSIIDY